MCKMLEEMREEAARNAALQAKISNAEVMLASERFTLEEVAMYSQLPLEIVREIRQ